MGIVNFKDYTIIPARIFVIAVVINIVAIHEVFRYYIGGMELSASFLALCIIAFNVTLYWLKRSWIESPWVYVHLVLLAIILWSIYLYHKPGFSGLLPASLFPLYVYLLKGIRRGAVLTMIFLVGLMMLYIATLAGIFDLSFGIEEFTGYLVALTIMLLLIYFIHIQGRDARKQFKSAVENYEALLDHLPVAVLMINKQFDIIAANQMARSWFPNINSPDKLICYRTIETGSNDSFCSGCPVEKAFKDGRVHSFEQCRKTPGGEQIFRVFAKSMVDKHGEVYAVTKMMEDITEKKQLESRLQETEELLRALGQQTSAAIFLYSDNRFLLLNPAFARITGYSLEDLYNMNNWEMIHPDYRNMITETVAGGIPEGEHAADFEIKIITRTGQERWVDFMLTSATINGKHIIIGTLFDINERKWAEETLQIEQHYMSFLMDNIPHQIYFKDTLSRFVRLNKAIAHRFGLNHAGEGIGKTDFDFFTHEHAQKAYNDEQFIMATGNPLLDIEEKETWPDGSITWVSTIKMLFKDHKGEIAGTFGISKDITDLRNAREKLRISEEKYRLITENALDVIWIYNFTLSRYTYVSSSVKHLRGFAPEEAIMQSLSESVAEESYQALYHNLMNIVADFRNARGHQEYQKIYEIRQPCKDGSNIWVEVSAQLQKNIAGEIEILGVSRNIEKRKRMEQEIIYNNQLQQLVTNCSGSFVNATPDSLDSKISATLGVLCEFFGYENAFLIQGNQDEKYFDITHQGYTPNFKDHFIFKGNDLLSLRHIAWWEGLLSSNQSIFIPQVDKMPIENAAQQAELKSQGVKSLAGFALLKNNHLKGVLVFVSGKKNTNFTSTQISAIKLIVNIISDSIERSKAQISLIISEQNSRKTAVRFQAFIDASNTGAWEYDKIKDKLWCSPRYFTMLGRNLDDYLIDGNLNFETWKQLLHPDDLETAVMYYNDYLKKPTGMYQQVFRLSHISGDYRWILSRGQLVKDDNGLPTGLMVGTHIDITEEKKREEIIKAKNKELESFLYVASHDLRSPLINIQGFSNRIEKQISALNEKIAHNPINENEQAAIGKILNENVPRSLSFIYSNVKKMDSLINGLLNISRTGQMKMTIIKIDMKALIDRILAVNDYQIEQSGASVEIGELPACYGDVQLLNQLFANLMDNAIKYRKQGMPLRINIKGKKKGSEVIYQLADNGQGIPSDKISRIWEVFYRADPTSDKPGDGIGLNIAQKIVEKHHGRIWAESPSDGGAVFYVQLQAIPF